MKTGGKRDLDLREAHEVGLRWDTTIDARTIAGAVEDGVVHPRS
jgi:hypothetical protein